MMRADVSGVRLDELLLTTAKDALEPNAK